MVRIAIIIGSTRPNRFGPQPAKWLLGLSKEHDATFELIDLAEINLPFLDEPIPPGGGKYAEEHTKKWSATIAKFDGFLIVHPEYNHGVSAALKNALDFLFSEWNYKVVALAGYGAEAGGSRAAEHLRTFAGATKMYDLREQLVIANYQQYLDKMGVFQPTEGQTKAAHNVLKELAFWAGQFKRARGERSK